MSNFREDFPTVVKGVAARWIIWHRVCRSCQSPSGGLQDSLKLCVLVREAWTVGDCAYLGKLVQFMFDVHALVEGIAATRLKCLC